MFQFTPYLLPLILSALTSLGLAFLIWKLRHNTPAYFMLAVIACLEIWIIGFIFEIANPDLEAKVVLANLQFIGIDILPVAWLALTLTYTGYLRNWNRFVKALLLIPALNQLVIWTDPLHHLFRHSPHLDYTSAPFPILVNDYTFWYLFIEQPFVYLIFLGTTILLIYTFRFTSGTTRKQIFFLLLSTIFPLVFNALYVLNLSPIPHLNLSSVGFTLSSVLLCWSLLCYGFLDLMPVVRGVLVDKLKDAWIVLDAAWRFVDLNQAAQSIIGQPRARIIGHKVEEVWSDKLELMAYLQAGTDSEGELPIRDGATLAFYDLSLSLLKDEKGATSGRLLILRDVTRRKQAEQDRQRLEWELDEAREQIKLLKGLLPVCPNCKNVREEEDYWQDVTLYLVQHPDLQFSQTCLCTSCLKPFMATRPGN